MPGPGPALDTGCTPGCGAVRPAAAAQGRSMEARRSRAASADQAAPTAVSAAQWPIARFARTFSGSIAPRGGLLARLHLDFVESRRRHVFDTIAKARWSVIAKERRSILLKSLTADIERVGQGAHYLVQFPSVGLTATVQITIALLIAPWITLVVL